MPARGGAWNGAKWVAPATRLALYLRDGLRCVYCGAGVEDGVKLTLDHIRPVERGGSNRPDNLVTACLGCNSARGARPLAEFARLVAERTGQSAAEVLTRVRRVRRRRMGRYRERSRAVLAERGMTPARWLARRGS